jgi:hypothetical protein
MDHQDDDATDAMTMLKSIAFETLAGAKEMKPS